MHVGIIVHVVLAVRLKLHLATSAHGGPRPRPRAHALHLSVPRAADPSSPSSSSYSTYQPHRAERRPASATTPSPALVPSPGPAALVVAVQEQSLHLPATSAIRRQANTNPLSGRRRPLSPRPRRRPSSPPLHSTWCSAHYPQRPSHRPPRRPPRPPHQPPLIASHRTQSLHSLQQRCRISLQH